VIQHRFFAPKQTRLDASNSDVGGSSADCSSTPAGLNNTEAVTDASVKLEDAKIDSHFSPLDAVTSQHSITQYYLVPNDIGRFVNKQLVVLFAI